jgi:hypothetical protein
MTDIVNTVLAVKFPIGKIALMAASSVHGSPVGSSQPSWIVLLVLGAVAGAIMGTLVNNYGGVLLYPLRRRRPDNYIGEWWEYHLSYLNGQRTLRQGKLTVKRGRRTKVRQVKFWHIGVDGSDDKLKLAYKGTLRIEGAQLLIQLKATTHKEYLVYRFLNLIPSNDSVVPGIWMAYDHNSNPAAGAAILSQRQMTSDQAEKEILTHANVGAIRIK